MCNLILQLANNSLWLCKMREKPYIVNTNKRIYNISNYRDNITTSHNNTINNTYISTYLDEMNVSVTSSPINMSENVSITQSPINMSENVSIAPSPINMLENISEPSPFSITRNSLSPSPSNNIRGSILSPSYSKINNILSILSENQTSPSSEFNSPVKENQKLDNIFENNLIYLHFLWFLLPIIIIIIGYNKKKNNKFRRIVCITSKRKKLKRCKSMPDLYSPVPVIINERKCLSDTDIDIHL